MNTREFESIKALLDESVIKQLCEMGRIDAIRFFWENVTVGGFRFRLPVIRDFIDMLRKAENGH